MVRDDPATLDEIFEMAKKLAREVKAEGYSQEEAQTIWQLQEIVLPLTYAEEG